MPKAPVTQETLDKILAFRDERDWRQFHTPNDLAISLSLEASELLECFQRSGTDLEVEKKREAMGEELADVLIYAMLFADRMGFETDELIRRKIEANARKYPVDLSKSRSTKYTELQPPKSED